MNDSEKIDQMYKDMVVMKRESRAQAIESKIQTVALIMVFVFGIATLHDMIKKIK